MKSIRGVFSVFALGVLATTLWFVVAQEPEARKVSSNDGVLTITGLSRTANDFLVSVDARATVAIPLISQVYRVAPADVPQDVPVVLSFVRSSMLGTRDATTVYWWNSALGMWEPVQDIVADTPDILAVRVYMLGTFALGITPAVQAPTMLTAFDRLRDAAPRGTRGYRMSVAYTLPDGVPTRLIHVGERGGCGGNIGAGDDVSYSSSSVPLSVLVDDVDTAVTFTIVSEWVISGDNSDCGIAEPLRAQG
jgi:hypothetical protein